IEVYDDVCKDPLKCNYRLWRAISDQMFGRRYKLFGIVRDIERFHGTQEQVTFSQFCAALIRSIETVACAMEKSASVRVTDRLAERLRATLDRAGVARMQSDGDGLKLELRAPLWQQEVTRRIKEIDRSLHAMLEEE